MVLVAANPHLENLVHATAILLPKRILASASFMTRPQRASRATSTIGAKSNSILAAASAAIAADFFYGN
jgi:hypothetical protein